ncbi:MAG: hypothetical protein OZSIB_2884 [Candidatus Ozemobacter sibiricus]|jgi:hypothetical protein|uniref:Uncharacterized protein n=1 Tax=Candidatus Ozemobacter sibiricus TaxID=2268124 RepID=A0A367ZT99_9BACT|nr:MAG: hypothetical protein OZSIB_2884 [Candidatus Ozemobacter sibiricus]
MTLITTWLGAFITLCCFSFLYKDNPFYRFAEHLFVGVSAGYLFTTIEFHQALKPNLLSKVLPATFGVGKDAFNAPEYILLIPAFMGVLIFFRLSSNLAWISRYSFAFVMGVSTGLAIVYTTQTSLLPQIKKAIVPLFVQGDLLASLSNWVLVIGSISCLFFFFFSTEHRGPVYGTVSRIGIWFLMISFGAAFGSTVMGRISLLIGRFQFLLGEWLHLL